jgi:sigma-B regulation protein RsbU (phosphoserine phosphatase)
MAQVAPPGAPVAGPASFGSPAPEPPHISRSVLRAVVAGESAVLASSKRQIGKDMVQMSMAASGLAVSAVACPTRTDASHMEILYVMFPGQYGTAEWLALVSLAASLYRQAEAAWIARDAAQTQALLEEELRRASEIQMRIVPQDFTRGDLDIGVGFVPFKGVGGDYVDALPTADGRVLVTVMDVAGKGMDAALIASGLHTAVHMSVRLGLSLIDIVQTLNRHLIDTWFASTSVTVAAAILDPRTGKVEAINCGHPTPLIVSADGRTRELKCHEEVPLGLMEIELKVGQDRLQSGEMLALYSDGLSELFDEAGAMLGVEGVTRYLAEIRRNLGPRRRASEIATQLHQRLAAFRGKAQASDDISFILALSGTAAAVDPRERVNAKDRVRRPRSSCAQAPSRRKTSIRAHRRPTGPSLALRCRLSHPRRGRSSSRRATTSARPASAALCDLSHGTSELNLP